jgi:heat shock protein HslJ
MRRIAPILVLVLVAVAGCAGAGAGPTSPPADEAPLQLDGPWVLRDGSLDGVAIPVLDEHPITLRFAGTEISGTAACNGYGGRVRSEGGRIVIDELGMTAMACEDAVMAAESAYVRALESVARISREGDVLTLDGPAVELRFAPLPVPPTADLVGTRWVLESLFVGDVASAPMGAAATLELRADGSFHGSTGCRTFDGTWIEAGEQIVATAMRMNEIECPADLAAQDGHVVQVIGDGFVPSIEEGLLTLLDPGSIGLVYAPAGEE